MSSGQGGGHLDQSFFRIATECAGVLKDFCRGQRVKAKKALQRLAQEHTNSFLPHRYLARLLYHESARVEADQQALSGALPSLRRLALLHSALLEAKQASELAPGSLSSAALRATLLVNLLVEESALQGGLAVPQEQLPLSGEQSATGTITELSRSAAASGWGEGSGEFAWYQLHPEARYEAIKLEFREAIAHCVRTLECSTPLLVEPVITISDAHARTCDPCCLRVQDSIVEWVKQDNWQRIVAEKRSVLACMHQVLESCHTLLDSTHIPVDGIVRLLQHILRPHQQDLQLWASQLLLSKGSVDDLQHKFETQAAVTELLRMLRPGRPGDEAAPGVEVSELGPGQALQSKVQLAPAVVQMLPAANAAQQQQQEQQQQQQQQQQSQLVGLQQQKTVGSIGQAAAPTSTDAAPAGRAGAGALAAPAPSPQQELAACLSAEQQWDEVREGAAMPSATSGAVGVGSSGNRRAGGKSKNKTKANDAARGSRKERSRYERYMDVETFWRTTSPEQRRELLKVPMAALLKGVRREQGNDVVDELIEGLVLLREQGNRAACYWLCPVCEQKFHSSRDFLGHVEMVHEGLAVQDNKYVCCYKCQQDVVGMYYTSTRTPGYNLCFRCYSTDAASVSAPEAFEKVFMRHSASRPWSSHSDFMSTRGSFSSLSDRSHRHNQQQQQQQQALGQQKLQQTAGTAGHVHSAVCRHHPHCPHHNYVQTHGHPPYGLETSSAPSPLKFGEASDEWLAPFPSTSLSAPVMMEPRAGLPMPLGAATLQPPHAIGVRSRGKRSSSDSDVSSDSVLGAPPHSRSLSEPTNRGRQAANQDAGTGVNSLLVEEGTDGSCTGSSSATWRSWWPTRLMQGWSGKGQQQQGPGHQQSAPLHQQQQHQPGGGPGSGTKVREIRQGPAQPTFDFGESSGVPRQQSSRDASHGSGSAEEEEEEDDEGASPPAPPGSSSPPGHAHLAGDLAGVDGFGGRMNGMVAELMTRLREIYLTDRDLGDTTLGYITQFVYRKLVTTSDDLHFASCSPAPRAVLLEFLAQPSIVFQRPQALAIVLGLLPLGDLQIVAAYAVRQHENAVSGMEAAARDIAAGSDEDPDVGPEEEDAEDTGGGEGSGSEQAYQLELAARREVARVAAAAEAAVALHLAAPMPRARRRLRYTSRRAPPATSAAGAQTSAGAAASSASASMFASMRSQPQNQSTGPGTPTLLPHPGGSFHSGGSHTVTLRCVDDDGSAEEVSEEDGVEYAVGTDGESVPLRSSPPQRDVAAPTVVPSMPRSQHQLEQLRHAGSAGMHLVEGTGAEGVGAILCDDDHSLEGSMEEGDDEDEDVEGEVDEDMSDEDEEDGVSLVPDEEEEDGPCVSLFIVAGDVELGFDHLITQMWGGGAENDDSAIATLDQPPVAANALPVGAAGAGSSNSRSRSQQHGTRGGRNQQQGRQHSPTSRSGGGAGTITTPAAPSCALASLAASVCGVGPLDDPLISEELVGPREDEPYLLVADWWLQHLRLDGGGPRPDELRVLRWVYGNIINVQAEEFCARQRELRGGRDRDTAILDLFDEVATVWRSLQAVTDKRSRLEALRRAARGHFAVVRRLEEAGGHASLEQATEFLDAVLSGYCQGQQGSVAAAGAPPDAVGDVGPSGPPEQPGTPVMTEGDGMVVVSGAAAAGSAALTAACGDETGAVLAAGDTVAGPSGPLLYLCERAVEVVRRHPALAQEPSQRYAAALLERELSVLALVEVMVAAEADDGARERGVAEESLKRHRAEHRDADAELQRVQAEGPASHRKKDLLDKATKEAEHREQLRELSARLTSLSDCIAADEANKIRYADKQEEADRELTYVRDAIRQTSARRASLLDVCATLDVPFAPPPTHHQLARAPLHRPHRGVAGSAGAAGQHAEQSPADGLAAPSSSPSANSDVSSAALALGPPSGGGLASAAADMEWRATRLECLMYRVLWVSEAVKMFQPQYSPRQSTHHYDLFIRATHWAKQLSEEYEESIRAYCCELERLRARLRDVAAVDLGYEIGAAALEVVRRRIEGAARAAREAASLTLLKELEEEEERRKAAIAAAKDSKDASGGAGGGNSKRTGANKKAARASQDSRSRAQKEKERELARQVEEEARRRAEEEDKKRVAVARRAREAALEAELERRRRELEELEAQREAEAIRAAQEASLREQQLREQCEREQHENEHREREQGEKEQREREHREREESTPAQPVQAQSHIQHLVAATPPAPAPCLSATQAAAGHPTAGVRKQEAPASHPLPQPHQHPRRQNAPPETSPEKALQPPPKRNAPHGSRARGSTVPLLDKSSDGSPESPVDPRVSAAVGQVPNGVMAHVPSRGGLSKQVGGAVIPSSAASPPQAGGQAAGNNGIVAAKGRQNATVQLPPPASNSGSPAAPDLAAAAAVAAATAGMKVVASPGGARSSPAKQGPSAVPVTPPAGSNAGRRQQQQQAQQQSQPPNTVGSPGFAAGLGGHGQAWATSSHGAAPSMAAPAQPTQAIPKLPVLPLNASYMTASGGMGLSGPISPGSEFPPLSVAAAASASGHRHPTPSSQQAPQPQMSSFTAAHQMQMHAQAQAQAQAHVQAQVQAQAQAQALADAHARLLAYAHGSGVVASVSIGAVQPQGMLPHGETAALPSEHLHAQFRQQQQLHQVVQHRYRQQQMQQFQQLQQQQGPGPQMVSQQQIPPHKQQQQQAQLVQQQSAPQQQQMQLSPQPQAAVTSPVPQALHSTPVRPSVAGVSAPVFDPFAENPVFKALAMDVKTPQPTSPSGGLGPAGALVVAASAGANQPVQLPLPQPPSDILLAVIQGSQSSSAAPTPEADTHIKSIMSILDQDGQSPSVSSGGSSGLSQQAHGPGTRASPACASGSAQSGPGSQTPTANSSPSRMIMPLALPPGPPASIYGHPYGMAGCVGGPPLLPPGGDGCPCSGTSIGSNASTATPAAGARLPSAGPMGALTNGSSASIGGVAPADSLAGPVPGCQPGALPRLSASSAFGSAIWRPGGEQLGGPCPSMPMGMLGLGLGLSGIGIGAGPNTWGSMGLSNSATGVVLGMPRSSSSVVVALPRQASSGGTGDWGTNVGGQPPAAANSGATGRDSGMALPDSVDKLVAALPTTLLPSSLDAEPALPPSTPPSLAAAAATSGLAPTAAPFYPASLRCKVGPLAKVQGGANGVGANGGMIHQQQQLMTSAGALGAMGMGIGMGPMSIAAMPGEGGTTWIGGLVPMPGKQGAAVGAMAGAAAVAAAAMTAAAANGFIAQGQHTAQQQLNGMAALSGAMGPGGMRYMGLYNGDGVNWSHGGGVIGAAGGIMSAPGVPAAVRATSSTWAPFVPPTGGIVPSQHQFAQQAVQQQAAQQPQQMAGWSRGQRFRS